MTIPVTGKKEILEEENQDVKKKERLQCPQTPRF